MEILYKKGNGSRPSHNFETQCLNIRELSRLVVLVYHKVGRVNDGNNVLWPITTSAGTGQVNLESPTYLFLHPEELLACLDRMCAKPIENTQPFLPNLPMLQVKSGLLAAFNQIQKLAPELVDAVEALQKESRRRKGKRAPDGPAIGDQANLGGVTKRSIHEER